MTIIPLVSPVCRFLLLVVVSFLALALPGRASENGWWVLGGPEKENGDPVEILSHEGGDLSLNVLRRRGHVAHQIEPVALPAVVSFVWESEYDPSVTEVATELWGTGDFRISLVGMPRGEDIGELSEENLGRWEGLQFRVFPHLDESPIRRRTEPNNESHTATSIWVRYADPDRLTGDNGAPHTGLQSDACQNRNKADGTHNCGWDRHTIIGGGFGLANKQRAEVVIFISEEVVYMEVNGRRFSIEPKEMRLHSLSAIVVGITNTSRGFRSLHLSDLRVSAVERPEEVAGSFRTTPQGAIEAYLTRGYPLSDAILQYSEDLKDWEDLVTLELLHGGDLEISIPEEKQMNGFYRVSHRPQKLSSGGVDEDWYFSESDKQGDVLRKVETVDNSLFLDTFRARGFYARDFEPVSLPAEITFKWQSSYAPGYEERATELGGTGDYRIAIVGVPAGEAVESIHRSGLGYFEGIQFRIFPHVDECPKRIKTPNGDGTFEGHTSTSIWERYADPDRIYNDAGDAHEGLQSDDCQRLGNQCGWTRNGEPMPNGFGAKNGETFEMRIYISEDEVSIEGNGRKWSVEPNRFRFEKLSAIQLGITNLSNGLDALRLTDFKAVSLAQ